MTPGGRLVAGKQAAAASEPTRAAEGRDATAEARVCMKCGRTEVGWRYNRCPNCGEMADEPASPAQAAPKLTRTLFGIRSKCDGTHKGPMEEAEAREWVQRFPDAYILVSKEETLWAEVGK